MLPRAVLQHGMGNWCLRSSFSGTMHHLPAPHALHLIAKLPVDPPAPPQRCDTAAAGQRAAEEGSRSLQREVERLGADLARLGTELQASREVGSAARRLCCGASG